MAVQSNNLTLLELTTGRIRTIDPASDEIELGVPITLTGGAGMTIGGSLVVNGTIVSVDTETLNVEDSHIYMNNGYTAVSGREGGIAVNYLPTATNDTVNGAFVAGVAGVSNPTVVTTGAATFAAGDCIQISTANEPGNNGLFEVQSHAANLLTLRGVGTTANTFNFFQNQVTADTTVAGTITQVNVSVLQAGTDGVYEVGQGLNTGSITFADLATAAGMDLNSAYLAGNTITTTGGAGDVTFTGTEEFVVSTAGGMQVDNFLNLAGTAGVELTAAAGGLSTGELIQINASGEAALADNNTGTVTDSFVMGASTGAFGAGTTAQIHTVQGALVPVLFGAAPAGASNGSEVFLDSTAGQATLTAPSGSGEVVYAIGILQGANGVTATPNVLFIPRLVAVIP